MHWPAYIFTPVTDILRGTTRQSTTTILIITMTSQWARWRLNHQPYECLLNRLFKRSSKKTSKFRVTGLCAGNSPVAGEFPAQTASNAEMFPFDHVIMLWLSCPMNVEGRPERHDMLSTLFNVRDGNPSVTGGFQYKWPVMRSFGVPFDVYPNSLLNNQSSCHYFQRSWRSNDGTVMLFDWW